MGFRDWLKVKKKKKQQERLEKRQAQELAERSFVSTDNASGFAVDPADINPPASRFTDEYKAFIEAREGVRSAETVDGDAASSAEEAVDDACSDS